MEFKVTRTSTNARPCPEAYPKHFLDLKSLDPEENSKGWAVRLETLDELLQFVQRYGEVVIGPWRWNPQVLQIEIYDSYRE